MVSSSYTASATPLSEEVGIGSKVRVFFYYFFMNLIPYRNFGFNPLVLLSTPPLLPWMQS